MRAPEDNENLEGYGLHSAFDAQKHKKKFINYLEVIILADGTVMYAVPSHQEAAAALACEKLRITRDELINMCPVEYYGNYMEWLLKLTGSVAVWLNGIMAPELTVKQILTLRMLKSEGLYKGAVPPIPKAVGKYAQA